MERVYFFISCFSATNTGNGGHYHSIKTIAEAYKRRNPTSDVRIISVGDFPPPALRKTGVPCENIHIGFRGAILSMGWMSKFKSTPPTHVHAFDRKAYFFAALIARKFGAKLYLTKPGGANPKRYFPFCQDIFVFSAENEAWFRRQKKFRRARIHFLPARAVSVTPDADRIGDIRQRYDLSGFVVLRIGRISPYYWRTAQQTLNLARALRSSGVPAKAVFIGTVEANATLEKLHREKHNSDIVITESEFTRNAAELLPVANVVVGTGRSAMEAAMAAKPVLCPTESFDLPVLLSRHTFADLMQANFSERSRISDPGIVAELVAPQKLSFLLSDSQGFETIRRETEEIAFEFFNIDNAIVRYGDIYTGSQTGALRITDLVVLWCGVVYATVRSLVKSA